MLSILRRFFQLLIEMRNYKTLAFCFLILSLTSFPSLAQNCDLGVTAEVIKSGEGAANGAIRFQMNDQTPLRQDIVIFYLTGLQNGETSKTQVEKGLIEHLSPGKHEFLILDRKRANCVKEILVEIKAQ